MPQVDRWWDIKWVQFSVLFVHYPPSHKMSTYKTALRYSPKELYRYAEEIRLVISSAIMNLDFVHANPALGPILELPEDPQSDYYKNMCEYRTNVYDTVLETWKLSSAAMSLEYFTGVNSVERVRILLEYHE